MKTINEMVTENLPKRAANEWGKIAGEPVEVELIKGALYAFGSELATLRLFKAFSCRKARQGFSQNLNKFYFELETAY